MANAVPDTESGLSQWIANFVTNAGSRVAELGITSADLTALTALRADLDAKVTAETSAKAAALAATAAKRTALKNALTQAAFRAKAIAVNPNIAASTKELLRVNTPAPKVSTPPTPPSDVAVTPFANGINRLNWNRNTNGQGTKFIIEAKRSTNGAWQYVDVVTAAKYDHINQTPGVPIMYRVRAKRGNLESVPSPDTVAYADAAFPD